MPIPVSATVNFIWQLSLDGSGRYRRLTFFSEYRGFGANNPVISPDGRHMAFGLRIKGEGHGNARGILLFDLERFDAAHSAASVRLRP